MSVDAIVSTFVPLFVATGAVSLLPTYVAITAGKSVGYHRRLLVGAILTAFVVGVVFLFVGKALLKVLGVNVDDFKLAGGVLLLVLSIKEIMSSEKDAGIECDPSGAVPLGVPLIVGPAVVTSLIMLSDAYGYLPCLLSFILNLLIVAVLFSGSEWVMKLLGLAVVRAAGRVSALLLAAYAIMMIRLGLEAFIRR